MQRIRGRWLTRAALLKGELLKNVAKVPSFDIAWVWYEVKWRRKPRDVLVGPFVPNDELPSVLLGLENNGDIRGEKALQTLRAREFSLERCANTARWTCAHDKRECRYG